MTATLPASPELTDEQLEAHERHIERYQKSVWPWPLVARLLAEIRRHRSSPSSAWRDIKDAPKDGTPILLAVDYASNFIRYIGRWHVKLNCWARGEKDGELFPAHMQGWFTKWMPLPEPPK